MGPGRIRTAWICHKPRYLICGKCLNIWYNYIVYNIKLLLTQWIYTASKNVLQIEKFYRIPATKQQMALYTLPISLPFFLTLFRFV